MVIRHLGPSMWNCPAWKINAPPQQNANIPQECQTSPGVLCLIVCTWSHYLAGRMCTPSKYVRYFIRQFESIYCVWSVASICTLLIYVWWKRKLIHVSANLYVLSKNYPINYEFWRYMSPNTVFYTSEKGGVRYRFVHSRGIVFDRLYMIPLPCGTYVYSLEQISLSLYVYIYT